MPSKIDAGRAKLQAPETAPDFAAYPEIRLGDRSKYVWALKRSLYDAGCSIALDNEWAAADQAELSRLRTERGIADKGALDAETQARVFSIAYPTARTRAAPLKEVAGG